MTSKKVKAAIIGSGNIGTDLMYKALRSEVIEPVWMVGIEATSDGLKRARELGLKTTHEGVPGLEKHLREDNIQIAWDATSAYAHKANNEIVARHGVVMIDLTPAAIGPFCIPPVNLTEHLGKAAQNVNMVTCGGQATIPMVAAVSRVQAVDYGEIVATVSATSLQHSCDRRRTRRSARQSHPALFARTPCAPAGNSPSSKPRDRPIVSRSWDSSRTNSRLSFGIPKLRHCDITIDGGVSEFEDDKCAPLSSVLPVRLVGHM
mgnify:CR=1 FL=1